MKRPNLVEMVANYLDCYVVEKSPSLTPKNPEVLADLSSYSFPRVLLVKGSLE